MSLQSRFWFFLPLYVLEPCAGSDGFGFHCGRRRLLYGPAAVYYLSPFAVCRLPLPSSAAAMIHLRIPMLASILEARASSRVMTVAHVRPIRLSKSPTLVLVLGRKHWHPRPAMEQSYVVWWCAGCIKNGAVRDASQALTLGDRFLHVLRIANENEPLGAVILQFCLRTPYHSCYYVPARRPLLFHITGVQFTRTSAVPLPPPVRLVNVAGAGRPTTVKCQVSSWLQAAGCSITLQPAIQKPVPGKEACQYEWSHGWDDGPLCPHDTMH